MAILNPFEVAGSRVARPFRDAYGWFDSLFNARSDANKLRKENEQLRQQLIQNEFAANELQQLKQLLAFKEGPSFPNDYNALTASVVNRPSSAFAQSVVVSAGSCDGVEKDAPVVTAQGLVGLVTRTTCHASRVTLLTDESSAVSGLDVKTDAAGVVMHAGGAGATLVLSFVAKEDKVEVGDTIATAGWRTKNLSSLYPKGIAIGKVTSVGQSDTDLYKQVQVQPFADFTTIDAVIVLVRKTGPMMTTSVKVAALVFVATIVQVSMLAPHAVIYGGTPDVLLVTLVCVALLRGSIAGAVAGFAGGLIVDIATLGTLGVTSLLLTVAGYWAGRYGETTGRDRAHAVPLAVVVITILVAFGGLGLHYMLGEEVSARRALVTTLLPAVPLNVLVAWPVIRLCRALLRLRGDGDRTREVELGV